MQIDANYLRDLVQSGVLSPEDVQNELTRLTSTIRPRNDIAPMTPNTMRVESGPDAGKVINLNFTGAPGTPQAPSLSMSDLQQQFEQQKPMRLIGAGNGEVVDLGTAPPEQVALDSSRPQVEIPGVGKADYGKDGNAYIRNPDGSRTKILLGYDRAGSMALDRRQQDMRLKDAEIARTQAATDLTRQNIERGDAQPGPAAPTGYQWNPDRTALMPIPGGPAASKPLTEQQANAVGFGMRAKDMDSTLNEMEQGGYTPTFMDINTFGKPTTNWATSAAGQKYLAAADNFTTAILRKESGATITPAEQEQARRIYIPMPGDSSKVLEQKRHNRDMAIRALDAQAAGNATTAKEEASARGPSAPSSGPARISGDAEYEALPSGTQFVGPDGKLRRKP